MKSIEASAFEKTAISNIGIKATTPPAASVSTFSSISKVNTTIYVPQGTISLYQKAEGWKEFLFIEEGQIPEYVSQVLESTVDPTPGGQSDVLVISGNLTGAIIKSINANSSIKKLDLSNAQIVLDKNAYYTSGRRVESHWDDIDVVRGAPYYSYNYYTAPENASGTDYERNSSGKVINAINIYFCCDLTNAFLNSSLTEIKLPSNLTKLGENAISGNNLKNLYVYGLTPPEATVKSFGNTRTSCILHVPAGTKSKYASANGWKAFTNIVEESQENYISTQPTNNSPAVKLAYTDSKATYQWYKKSKENGTEMDCTDAFSSQGWEKDGQNWISSNHASDSKATLSMEHSFKKGDILSFAWKVMSETPFDQLQCRMGDEVIIAKSGIDSGTCSYTFAKDISGTLNFYYIKDNSVDENEDKAIISNVKITSKTSFEIPVTSAIESEITSTLNRKSCKNGDKVWCIVTLGDNRQLVSDTIDISYTTITDISFKSQETTMETGEVKSIQPTLVPSNAFNDEFLWESSNNQIAKVDATGTVTALAVGNATITAHTKDGSNLAASYTINVKQGNYIKRQPTKDNMSVELAFEDKEAKYQWYNISAYKIYSDSICDYEKDITELFYTSGSHAGGDGWQYVDGKWNCEITNLEDVVSYYDAYYYYSLYLDIDKSVIIPSDSIFLNCKLSGDTRLYYDDDRIIYNSGHYAFKYDKILSPNSHIWELSTCCHKQKYGACELSNIVVKGKRPYCDSKSTPIDRESYSTLRKKDDLNSVFCEITLYNGRKIMSDTIMLSDVIEPEFINLSSEKLNIKLGDTASLTAIVNPLNSTDTSVKWESSNSDVATVSQNGEITAVAAGTSIISVKTSNGIIASCEVKVIDPNVHEYVDLGLPSGLLWATTDIGALTPEDEGLEFVWGGTSVDTKWEDIKDIVLEYDEISDTEYDVAKIQWGNGWRLPTAEEAKELMKYCTSKSSNTQEIDGYKNSDFEYTGPNGNSIFFYHVFHEYRNTFYMTGTIARRDFAYGEKNYWLNIGWHGVYGNDQGMCGCYSKHRVRPVIEAKNASVKNIEQDSPQIYNVYNLNGSLTLKTNEKSKLRSLPKGIYIVNGKKMVVK